MARGTTAGSSEAYIGMLGVACFGMVVGIFCLVMEAGDYDWSSKPTAAVPDPKGQLPKPPAADPAGAALIEPEPAKPAVAAKPADPAPPVAKPSETKPEVASKPADEPQPLPKAVTPAAEPKPDGPTPSPIQIRPKR